MFHVEHIFGFILDDFTNVQVPSDTLGRRVAVPGRLPRIRHVPRGTKLPISRGLQILAWCRPSDQNIPALRFGDFDCGLPDPTR